MAPGVVLGPLLRRTVLVPAAGLGLAAAAMRYYLTHPQRVVVELPEDLASVSQDVSLEAEDGARLRGVWVKGCSGSGRSTCDRTIVHYHGFNSCGGLVLARRLILPPALQRPPLRRAVERQLRAFVGPDGTPLTAWPLVRAALDRGYNFLLVDIRGHGRSDGPWDTTGLLATKDLIRWIHWLRMEQDQLWVALWGNSFGAAVGLGLATRSIAGGLDAMVLDSAPVSAKGLYSGKVRPPLYWAVQPVILALGNHQLLHALRSSRVQTPILLIHGMADTHVPHWQSQLVYNLAWRAETPEQVQLWLVPGADHLEALEVAPRLYVQRTLDWFDRWFG